MKLTSEQIAELRQRAEKATPGPWRATQFHVYAAETEDRLGFDLNTKSANGNRDDASHLAAYIAATNPQVISALIEDLEDANARAPIISAAELYQLKEQNHYLVGLYDAVKNLIKVKGRHNTEVAYQRLMAAFDSARDVDAQTIAALRADLRGMGIEPAPLDPLFKSIEG